MDTFLAERVRTLRLERGLAPDEIDRRMGLKAGTVARMEAGTRRVYAGDIYRLADAFDVPVSAFFPPPAAPPDPPDPNTVRPEEVVAFINAYQRLTSPGIRKQISDLTKSVAARRRRSK